MANIVKLSKKIGGHGYVSSYSINISPAEAKILGLLEGEDLYVEKIIDSTNSQIVLKAVRQKEIKHNEII